MYNSEMKKITSQRLRELRQEKNLTFGKLADCLSEKYDSNISVPSLKNYEVVDADNKKFNAVYGMKIEYLYIFADFYNVTTDYLLGRSDFKNVNEPDIDNLKKQLKTEMLEEFKNFMDK